ncbi:hypothetical protein NLU13_8768, partial [Sarocladium strictum]
VFNHAVANLQSTYATQATLRLTYVPPLVVKEAMGPRVDVGAAVQRAGGLEELSLPLGNLQYGQSRDVFLKVDKLRGAKVTMMSASLHYKRANIVSSQGAPEAASFESSADLTQPGQLSEAEIAFHESRAQLCTFILSMFQLKKDLECTQRNVALAGKQQELKSLIDKIPAAAFSKTDEDNEALMEDICGEDPAGQVQLAISQSAYLERWGYHYLLSYVNAHTRQICNSFKDPGPQRYGISSPLFKRCLAQLDEKFDKLPPPKPSRQVWNRQLGKSSFVSSASISISKYNRSSAPCFAGSTAVELASGRRVSIKRVRRGMRVRTPLGPRRVALVLKTPVEQGVLCRIGSLLVTPWHPISLDGGKTWDFPANVEAGRLVRYTGAVYSVMLERDARTASHAIRVEDAWGVTLGHGMTATCDEDIRGHAFWGDWARVSKEVMRLGVSRGGVAVGAGVERDPETGLVTALK